MTKSEMKSKVMTLGNKLAGRIGERSEAFVKAWAIVKRGDVELSVRGVTFGSRQYALTRLAQYPQSAVRAFLMPEPGNVYDPNALAVMVGVQGGRGYYKLGYVPATYARAVNALGRRVVDVAVKSGSINGAVVTVRV